MEQIAAVAEEHLADCLLRFIRTTMHVHALTLGTRLGSGRRGSSSLGLAGAGETLNSAVAGRFVISLTPANDGRKEGWHVVKNWRSGIVQTEAAREVARSSFRISALAI